MVTFLHPGFLYTAAGASAVVVALHFLVAEQPRAGVLPTVRFFPDVEVRSTTLAVSLSDLLLLLVRVLTLMLIGAAFAQPHLKPSRSAILRIVAVDVSRDVAKMDELRDSAKKYLAGSHAAILFDSTAAETTAKGATDSISVLYPVTGGRRRGALSSALIVALRASSRMSERADSIELVLISPLASEEGDGATLAIRALWPGGITVVRVAAARDTLPRARAAAVEWADSSATSGWVVRAKPDTIGAVRFDGGVLVYPFIRRWKLAPSDASERVTARWADGEPAMIERGSPAGCIRSISVPIPAAGDAILRPSFARFFARLSAPCISSADYSPLLPGVIAAIQGPAHLAPTSSIRPQAAHATPLVWWLLGGALLLALIELPLRTRDLATRKLA